VAQSRALLAGDDQADVVHADLREPDRILGSKQAKRLLDFDQPVGLLMVAILQVIPDADDPTGVVARFRDRVTAGSHLVIAHPTADNRSDELGRVREIVARMPATMTPRTHQQISRFFAGFDLVEPGLVWVAQWRAEPGDEFEEHPERSINYGGVGRKA
jgi:S-adenosyl methyltransferase